MKIGIAGLSMATALAVIMLASRAPAQQTALTPDSAPSQRETNVDLNANFLYDSNVARSDRQQAETNHLVLADELFTPRANFGLARQFGPDVLFLNGTAGYLFHRHDTVLNRENIDVQSGVNARLARCHALLSGEYSRLQNDLADQFQTTIVNVVGTTSVGLAAECGQAIGFSPTASVTQTWRNYSALVDKTIDSNTLTATAGVTYAQPLVGLISLRGTYSQTNLPYELLPNTNDRQTLGFTYYDGGLYLDRHLGGRLEATAGVSYEILDPNSTTVASFSGLTYSLDTTYRINAKLSLHANAERSTTPTNRPGTSYSVTELYGVNLNYALGSRLKLGLGGSSKTRGYPPIVGQSIEIGGETYFNVTRQVTHSVLGTAQYLLSQRLTLSLEVADDEVKSNLSQYCYSSTRVGLTVVRKIW